MKRRVFVALIFVLAALAVSLALASGVTALTQANAQVRLVHAVPGLSPVDMYVDGARVVAGTSYREVSSYLSMPAGNHLVQVFPAGVTNTQLISTSRFFVGGWNFTVAAVNTPTVEGLVFVDDNSPPPASKARIRFVHMSPDLPALTIRTGGILLFENVAFKRMANSLLIDAGTYDLEVLDAATGETLQLPPGSTLMPPTQFTFKDGEVYTIYAMGTTTSDPGTAGSLLVPSLQASVDRVNFRLLLPVLAR
jgi:hypothetical protein